MIKHISDFIGNDTERLHAAAEFLRNNKGTTLVLEPKTYILHDDIAARLQKDVMEGKYGENCEDAVFNRNFRYRIGIDLNGAEDVVIDGNGATISVDGFMETLSLSHCKNVTVKNLSFDLLRKAYSHGKILSVDDKSMDVRFPNQTMISASMPADRMWISSRNEDRFTAQVGKNGIMQINSDTLRFIGKYNRDFAGDDLYVWHCFHFRPMILIYEAENTLLENIFIFNNCGMGIVGHRSRDIILRRVMIIPSVGENMSTNTDATHFTSCRGLLRFEDCMFEGQGDDATNVHTYYHSILEHSGTQCTITTLAPTGTHCQKPDYPDVGDILEFSDNKNLDLIDTFRVVSSEPDPSSLSANGDAWNRIVTLDKPLPEDCSNGCLSNISQLPRLEFIGCSTRNHLARSVLVKTRNVLIEGCLFDCSMSSAIHVASEIWWSEGVPSENVIIRNNRIIRRGPKDRFRAERDAGGICINIPAKKPSHPLHKNIFIENNMIVCPDTNHAIYASDVDGLTIRNNELLSAKPDETIVTERCTSVVMGGNRQ